MKSAASELESTSADTCLSSPLFLCSIECDYGKRRMRRKAIVPKPAFLVRLSFLISMLLLTTRRRRSTQVQTFLAAAIPLVRPLVDEENYNNNDDTELKDDDENNYKDLGSADENNNIEGHVPHTMKKTNNIQQREFNHRYQNQQQHKNLKFPQNMLERVLSKAVFPKSEEEHRRKHRDSIIGKALHLENMLSNAAPSVAASGNGAIRRPGDVPYRLAQICDSDDGENDSKKTCWSTTASFHPPTCTTHSMIKAGQILQIFQKRSFGASNNKGSNGEIGGSDSSVQAAATETMRYDAFVLERAYQLVEPMHLELGLGSPKHYLDYAYTPVMERPVGGSGATKESEDSDTTTTLDANADDTLHDTDTQQQSRSDDGNDDLAAPTCKAVVSTPDKNEDDVGGGGGPATASWWQWWFPSFSKLWWQDHHGSAEHRYEKDKNAFAGGSHGEVWRGHRVCSYRNKVDEDYDDDEEDNGQQDDDDACNDLQPLILKRLNVARGYRLLEAGLREIYFGQLLLQEIERHSSKDDGPMVTVYVDHFFREVPRAFGRGKQQTTTDLELWIVFEDAGPSLRNYLYEPLSTTAGFIVYQHSRLWTQLRFTNSNSSKESNEAARSSPAHERTDTSVLLSSNPTNYSEDDDDPLSQSEGRMHDGDDPMTSFIPNIGKELMRHVLHQILSAAATLHEHGIVHRDIKPSNVMCTSDIAIDNLYTLRRFPNIQCRLGDFSSGWDKYSDEHLYTKGPSPAEQTDEYAPPESYLGPSWTPFDTEQPQSFDSWSIGVLVLELLLGTPNVFSVDQRTTVLLTRMMEREGSSEHEIQHALYLAALSQFCIYVPASNSTRHESWPLRHGDPLHKTAMAKDSCTLQDFHRALRARDPLGIGFDSSTDLLLHLVWQLLAFDPKERMSPSQALQHAYFTSPTSLNQQSLSSISGQHKELEAPDLSYDPRLQFESSDTVDEFICPKCGRIFNDWRSCHRHANTRRHAKFCTYDRSNLPTCINTHSMLPAHPTSGYCDLQGRRHVIEDFHSIHLYSSHQFYGMFDGHSGNLASKYAASTVYGKLVTQLSLEGAAVDKDWKAQVQANISQAFHEIHREFLIASSSSHMDQSGTTATALLVTKDVVVVAGLGDSRAVLSVENNGKSSALALTEDHVASDPIEKKLVEHRGGTISSSGGIPRVNGTLAITRSIGDENLASLLSREPHVMSMTREEIRIMCGKFDCFIVVASDGLWDVMSNQEAVDMVSQTVDAYDATDRVSWNNGGAYQEAAEVLALEAYVRGSTDNIGVCVIALDQ